MADRVERVSNKTVADGNQVVTERRISTDDRDENISRAAQLAWFIVGVLETILALRFILSLMGANTSNAFASLIYNLSNPFVAPFRGLLRVGTVDYGISRFELETLIAMLVYGLVGAGIVSLISLGRKDV